jgi:hypothetical protein
LDAAIVDARAELLSTQAGDLAATDPLNNGGGELLLDIRR